eukprot:TRINITY_DN1990_c0_g1_i5.p1 TRINITY_DN1990_c0_g1~~TRINITY_DN1990_c0_g1_i5.p1  ORF type:complete len:137 (+),score=2.54 TRINITY_DN1990_c0_g1_i5:737-1147(+)
MEKASNLESKMYVLDTNVLLHEPLAYLSFQEHNVVIPMTVLEELDHIKDRKHDVSRDARVAIRGLDEVLKNATPEQMLQGVALPSIKRLNRALPARSLLLMTIYLQTQFRGCRAMKTIIGLLIVRYIYKSSIVIQK